MMFPHLAAINVFNSYNGPGSVHICVGARSKPMLKWAFSARRDVQNSASENA
jgi:hypothetical protein